MLHFNCARNSFHMSASRVLTALEGFRHSQVLFAGVRLGVFEKLVALSPNALDVHTLAKHLNCISSSLERLLSTCAAMGLVDSPAAQKFCANQTTKTFLVRSSSQSLVGYVEHSMQLLWPLWNNLHESVKSNENAWEITFGKSKSDVFSSIYGDPQRTLRFAQAMQSFASMFAPRIVQGLHSELSRFMHFADVGGGAGVFAQALIHGLESCPKVSVCELKEVVQVAPELAGVESERIDFVAGNFLPVGTTVTDSLPRGVDAVILSRILHDWDDNQVNDILDCMARQLNQGQGLLIVEMLIDQPDDSLSARFQDLNMLIQTKGRERTIEQYRQLVEKRGFSFQASVILQESLMPSGILFIKE